MVYRIHKNNRGEVMSNFITGFFVVVLVGIFIVVVARWGYLAGESSCVQKYVPTTRCETTCYPYVVDKCGHLAAKCATQDGAVILKSHEE